MSRLLISSLCAALLAASPAALGAQQGASTPVADPTLARAQRLVSGGEGAAGRALVDSVIAATPAESPRYAEALFVRASLAATAAQAERDYRRIFIEYPLSPRAPEALMRLAQLEIARGDRARAVQHLERLTREHPGSPAIPRANYWLARARFEGGDVPRACEALGAARSTVPASDVELRNQVEYYARRCVGVGVGVGVAGSAGVPTESDDESSEGRGAPPAGSIPPSSDAAGTDPSPVGADSREGAASAATFSVQVAAYGDRASAERLAAKLAGRGHAARVAGSGPPYRVRVGRYRTRAEAALAARRLQAQRVSGIVVESEPR